MFTPMILKFFCNDVLKINDEEPSFLNKNYIEISVGTILKIEAKNENTLIEYACVNDYGNLTHNNILVAKTIEEIFCS